MDFVVTPWISEAEWREVYNMIISFEAEQLVKAEEIIAAWQTRVDRLPTGVETTLCLIQAALAWCENPDSLSLSLTFSSAIIRFLNLTSHVGMNKFGLKKIHEVAEKFSIPARLVELRHDTTHGEMKSKETLLEGLALALQWTVTNYWQWEAEHKAVAENEDVGMYYQNGAPASNNSSKVWLECYQYLKIYSIWGNETLGELKSDSDTYDHVTSLWNQLTVSSQDKKDTNGQVTPKTKRQKKSLNPVTSKTDDIDKVRIREALGLIRNKLQSWMSQRNKQWNGETLVKTLVDETLLLSDRDFVESLLEESESESKLLTSLRQEAKLPQNLAKSWSDILRLLSETGHLTALISHLYAVSGDLNPRHSDSFSKDLATAWICDILRSLQAKTTAQTIPTPSKKSKQRKSMNLESEYVSLLQLGQIDYKTDPVWQSLFMDMIMNPNERTSVMLPILVKMIEPPLTTVEEKKILDVMDIFHGRKLSEVSKKVVASDIKTLDSLINANLKSCGKWQLVEQVDWENVPFGLCPGQTEESFLRDLENLNCNSSDDVAADSSRFKNSKLTFLQDSTVKIEAKDWAALNGGSGERYDLHRSPNVTNENVPAFYRAR